MSDTELEKLADKIAERLEERQNPCSLTAKEQEAVRDIIKTKKQTVRALLWLIGAIVLWALKDAYLWLAGHLTFR